jgi:hypothetical protein
VFVYTYLPPEWQPMSVEGKTCEEEEKRKICKSIKEEREKKIIKT